MGPNHMKLALSRSKQVKFGVEVLGARAMAATVATRRLAAILAADVGVRHVLAGSVRRTGNRVRVSAQLIDAATGAHLWAERFDGDTGDLFALQNEITGRLANALGVELIAAEALRPTEHPDALDYILRGRAVLLKPGTRDTHREAIHWFERALATSPRYAFPHHVRGDVLRAAPMGEAVPEYEAALALKHISYTH